MPLPPDPPDLAVLAELATRGLRELPGCHAYAFDLARHLDLGVFGEEDERYQGAITLRDGAWEGVRFTVVQDDKPGSEVHIRQGGAEYPFLLPMIGAIRGEDGSFRSLLGEVVDGLGGPTELLWVELDPEVAGAWALYRSRSVAGRRKPREVLTRVAITPAPLRARRWVATLERPIPLDEEGGAVTMDQIHLSLDVDEAGLPTGEQLRARLRLGPFRLRMEQSTTLTRQGACEAAEPPPAAG